MKIAGKLFKITGIVLGIAVLLAAVYVTYVLVSYYRIEDAQTLAITDKTDAVLPSDGEYTLVTCNLGFGAYSQDFSFFMDGGTESVARSRESVIANISGSAVLCAAQEPDFLLLQEVDLSSTRSYHVDQLERLRAVFAGCDSVLAVNYDSPFLAYPLLRPHGKSLSGIATFSRYDLTQSLRRSLPISTGFSKFFDLDRCYSVSEIPADNGKSLWLYNVHLSAYGTTPEIRDGQIRMLFSDIAEKYADGDYVICGGDFNHELLADADASREYGWAQPFPFDLLPAGIRFAPPENGGEVPTCRNCDTGYVAGETEVFVLDGFFVSDNVEAVSVQNISNDFLTSDHNPVKLRFRLKTQQ